MAGTETESEERGPTHYVVLKRWDGDQTQEPTEDEPSRPVLWHVFATTDARTKQEALNLAARDGNGSPLDGAFKAVPARSWKGGRERHVEMVAKVTENDLTDADIG